MFVSVCLLGMAWLLPAVSRGQSSYNPYEPFNNQYREYSRPGGFNMFDAMSSNRSQNSTYEAEMDRLLGDRETSGGKSRDSDRYYNAFRKYDEQLGRIYRPNQDVDKLYNQRKSNRDSIYFKALREKDPKKKAALMKSYARGEDLSALKDDGRVSEKSAMEKKKTGSSRSGTSSSSSSSSRSSSSTNRRSGSSRGSLLGGSDGTDRTDDGGSLTERSGRLSEEIRPSNSARGYGATKSREEQKKAGSSGRSSSGGLGLPGLPGLRP